MKTKFIEKEIKYTGTELSPHWVYKNFNLQGDAVVAFVGECEVNLTEMVDIEDLINNEPIYSKSMLNFIVEHFNINLIEGVTRQRLFICIIKEVLENILLTSHPSPLTIERKGDDLYIEGKKLSVSIATKSPTSVLMHIGLNINSEGAPVQACGLNNDLNFFDIVDFAQKIMVKYSQEIDDIILASTKVVGRN